MRQLLQKLSQSLAMPNILKLASHHFIVYPFFRPEIRRRPPALHALTLSQLPHGNYFAMHSPHTVSIWLEAEYDPSITNQTRPELWVIERNSGRLLFKPPPAFCYTLQVAPIGSRVCDAQFDLSGFSRYTHGCSFSDRTKPPLKRKRASSRAAIVSLF